MSQESTREQLVAQYTLLARLAEEARRRIELFNDTINDIANARRAVEEIAASEGEIKILVPLGSGVLAKAVIVDKERFLVNIGANVVVEKTFEAAQRLLEYREKSIREALQRQVSEYQAIMAKLAELEQMIQASQG